MVFRILPGPGNYVTIGNGLTALRKVPTSATAAVSTAGSSNFWENYLADNGVKQAGFYVLRGTHAPAILFEMAYISNKKDEAKLESKKYRRKIVDGLYAGILDFAKRQGWLVGAN